MLFQRFFFGTIPLFCKYLLEAYEVLDPLSKTLKAKEIKPKEEKEHVCRIMGIVDGALKDGDWVRVFTYITSLYFVFQIAISKGQHWPV